MRALRQSRVGRSRRSPDLSPAAFFVAFARPTAVCLVAIFLAALLARPAWALDPSLDWSTIETPHFSIHFHEGLEGFAARTAEMAEEALRRLGPFLDTWPRERVEVVVSDSTDSANGSATVYPRALIRLNPTPPDNHSELNDHDDWLWALVLHELTHVLHLGDIGGLPRAINTLIGQQWIPNAWQPNWVVEGFAVQAESRFTVGGRNRSSIYSMQLRLMALEDALPDLDDISGSPSRWPRGVAPYLAGARFIDWIVNRHGALSLAALSHDYGSAPLPFLLNLTARRVLGQSWIALYREWKREVTREAQALKDELMARGMSELTPLTDSGERTGSPRFCAPWGEERVCYIDAPGTRRPTVRSRRLNGTEERVHAELLTTGELAVSPDGRRAVVSQLVTFDTDYSFEDLYLVDLERGDVERLTFGARASAPDFAPDGLLLAFVQRRRGGTTALMRLRLDTMAMETLVESPPGEAIFTPRHAPDGRAIAYSAQTLNGRDLVWLDLDSLRRERLTTWRALDLDPAFEPSGQTLCFVSDVGGIYDVFRLDLATGAVSRLTRLVSGAFSPDISRDGQRIALVTYSSRGADIAMASLADLKPEAVDPAELKKNARSRPAEFLRAHARPPPPDRFDRLPPPDVPPAPLPARSTATRPFDLHPYRPWKSLGARAWMPTFQSDADGSSIGLSTFGEDAVGLHAWTAEGGVGIGSRAPYAAVSYSYRGIRPELSLSLASVYGRGHLFGAGQPERQWQAYLSALWPVRWDKNALWFSLVWQAVLHQALSPRAVGGTRGVYPDNALISAVQFSLGWSNTWTPAQGISPGEGWSLSVTLNASHRAIGSDLDYATASASLTRYLSMPWHDLHVLALRLRGGVGWSPSSEQALFSLGGTGLHNPIADFIQGTSTSTTALRGYPSGALLGRHFWMASAEYRLPIAIVDWGPWTLPLYFKRLHGALTADAGWAGVAISDLGDIRPSIGAVLRLEAIVGHDFGAQLQLGYAFGLGRGGIHNVYLGLGSGF